MREDKVAYNPQGVKIAFNEETHRYWSTYSTDVPVSGDQHMTVFYESVTTMLKRVAPVFDEKAMAASTAAKNNMTVDQVIEQWHKNRDQAGRFGTRVHAIAEDTLKSLQPRWVPESERERLIMSHAWSFATDAMKRMRVVVVEQIVFSPALQLAGQIDFALRDTDGCTWIMDWKTNKEIRKDNPWGKTLLAPVAHLPDCEFIKHALQLSTYEWILRHEGYIARDAKAKRAIVHLTEQGAQLIQLPDLKMEVLDILLHRAIEVPI